MRKRLLTLGLAVILGLSSTVGVGAYTFTKEGQGMYAKYTVSDISRESLEKIRENAVSDIEMLDDIVERSYDNNFQNKNYIIKTKGSELKRTINLEEEFGVNVDDSYGEGYSEDYDLWGNYLHSRGDTWIAATFSETTVVRDEENDCYYHSVKVTSKPYWDAKGGFFDFSTRKLTKYDEYIENIKNAEKEMGFVEGNNLCDFQLIDQVYVWIKDHVKFGSNLDYNPKITQGQTAIGCITSSSDKWEGVCAGQSRLFNRFMHDMGIDSYWTSYPAQDHAYNRVRLSNNYYGVDCQASNYNSINLPDGQYQAENFTVSLNKNEKEYTFKNNVEIFSIMYYNKQYEEQLNKSWKEIYVQNLTAGHINSKLKSTDSKFHFEDKDWKCPYCSYTGNTKDASHTFDDTNQISTKRVELNKSKIVPNAGFEVYNRKLDSNGNYLPDCFRVFVDGKDVNVEKNPEETTTEEPTTPAYEEATTNGSEVEPETPAPDYPEPTTKVEVPTTKNNEDVPEIPTPNHPEVTTTGESVTVKSVEPVTTTEKGVETKTTKVTVKPGKVKKVTAKNNKKKSIKLTWKKATNAKKYQIQYSTSKKFKKKAITKATKKLKYTIKRLAKEKTYYIRVRGVNGKEVGKWSTVKKVKIRK